MKYVFMFLVSALFSLNPVISQEIDVDGSIKIGASSDTPVAGTIRWNDTTQDFEGYTGTEWKSLTLTSNNVFGNPTAIYNSTESQKLTASDASAGDFFGQGVSISNNYACVGAYGRDDNGEDAGAAYIFMRSGTTWTQQAKITAGDAAPDDLFGYSVSIDGDYACIGANFDDDGGLNSGAAYIFKRSGTSWSQQAKLTASDASAGDLFGYSVSISGDYACIGAYGNDDSDSNSGSAYIFHRSGTSWTQQAKLTANDADTGDFFGYNVSNTSNYACVGAYGNDDSGSFTGSAYIFARSGTSWSQQAKLTASDADAGDSFGFNVSNTDNYACIGAYGNDDNGSDSGSAYIFARSGTSWTQQTKLTAEDASSDDNFGYSVSMTNDYTCIGAYTNDDKGSNSGSAYLFARSGTSWMQQAKLIASDAEDGDYFGQSVDISGETIIIGAYADGDDGVNSGSAYIFQ